MDLVMFELWWRIITHEADKRGNIQYLERAAASMRRVNPRITFVVDGRAIGR